MVAVTLSVHGRQALCAGKIRHQIWFNQRHKARNFHLWLGHNTHSLSAYQLLTKALMPTRGDTGAPNNLALTLTSNLDLPHKRLQP